MRTRRNDPARRRSRRRRWPAALAVLVCTFPAPAAAREFIVAYGSAVSGVAGTPQCGSFDDPAERPFESLPQIGVDPASDGARVVAVYLQDGDRAAVGATSDDGGRSWTRTPIAGATRCTGTEERH